MSMAAILQATAQHLRNANAWEVATCDIQPNSEPPAVAGQYYVAIDDGGTDATARPEDHYLREVFVVEVAVWRRPGQMPKDRMKELMKNASRYFAEMETLESLERAVIRSLHKSQQWRAVLNQIIANLPMSGRGDQVVMPLLYTGRGKNETFSPPDTGDVFFGRRLRFRGGDRIQNLEYMR